MSHMLMDMAKMCPPERAVAINWTKRTVQDVTLARDLMRFIVEAQDNDDRYTIVYEDGSTFDERPEEVHPLDRCNWE